jgi:hypothetical protein
MMSQADSIEANQDGLFNQVRDEIVEVFKPERVLVTYLPRGQNDLEIRSRFGVPEEACLDTADVSLTIIQNALRTGEPLSCIDAGDVEMSDSLSCVLLGLSSVCVAPIVHPSGLRIGVLFVDDRREVGRYQEPDAELLGRMGLELGKKLSTLRKTVVIEPTELKLPELPPDKNFAKVVTQIEELATTPKLEKLERAEVQQLLDSIEQSRETGGVGLARLQNELAQMRRLDGDFVEAEKLLRECLETMRIAGLHQTLEGVSFLNNLAGVLYRKGDLQAAEATYIQTLKFLDEKNPDHWSRAVPVLCNLGTLYAESQRIDKAGVLLTRAAELALETWGAEDPRTQRCLAKLSPIQSRAVESQV